MNRKQKHDPEDCECECVAEAASQFSDYAHAFFIHTMAMAHHDHNLQDFSEFIKMSCVEMLAPMYNIVAQQVGTPEAHDWLVDLLADLQAVINGPHKKCPMKVGIQVISKEPKP